jgi:hypothetical protein
MKEVLDIPEGLVNELVSFSTDYLNNGDLQVSQLVYLCAQLILKLNQSLTLSVDQKKQLILDVVQKSLINFQKLSVSSDVSLKLQVCGDFVKQALPAVFDVLSVNFFSVVNTVSQEMDLSGAIVDVVELKRKYLQCSCIPKVVSDVSGSVVPVKRWWSFFSCSRVVQESSQNILLSLFSYIRNLNKKPPVSNQVQSSVIEKVEGQVQIRTPSSVSQ